MRQQEINHLPFNPIWNVNVYCTWLKYSLIVKVVWFNISINKKGIDSMIVNYQSKELAYMLI